MQRSARCPNSGSNSYNRPQGPGDPYEDHPYLLNKLLVNNVSAGEPPHFEMRFLERMEGSGVRRPPGYEPGHAAIINEYDWIWHRHDGTPTLLSRGVYQKLLGPGATSEQRRELAGYVMGALTEYWRAYRQYAGVMFYTYLALDDPRANTCDYFSDVESGVLEPYFADYMREAFKPLGVYVRFWQPSLSVGESGRYEVMLVNDTYEAAQGRLELLWESEGKMIAGTEVTYHVAAVGQKTYQLDLAAPRLPGEYLLKALAFWGGKPFSPSVSRRKVSVGTASTK